MEILLAWSIGAVIVGLIASSRGRDALRWMIVAALLSPIVAVVLVFALGRIDPNAPTTRTHQRCPDCQEWIQRTARKCKHCGAIVANVPEGMIVCPFCRAGNPTDGKHCVSCSGNLRDLG